MLHALLLGLALFGSSSAALADDACGLPVCDIPAKIQEFRAGGQNARYQAVLVYTNVANATDSKAALLNLAELAKQTRALFTELSEEDWMFRAVDALAATCLSKLAVAPETTVDELIGYFRALQGDSPRFATLNVWRGRIAALETKAQLLDLARFFAFARGETASNERWVNEVAVGGGDAISAKLLLGFVQPYSLEEREMTDLFHAMGYDSARFDLLTALMNKVSELGSNVPALARLNTLFVFAVADSAGRENWVIDRAKSAVDAVNTKLLAVPGTKVEQLTQLYGQLYSDSTRLDVLRAFRANAAAAKSAGELVELSRFFRFARDNSRQSADWVQNAAAGGVDDVSVKALMGFDLSVDQMKDFFHQIGSDNTRNELLTNLTTKAQQTRDNDAYIERLSSLFEFAIGDSAGHERWVIERAQYGLEQVNARLIKRAVINAPEMIRLFRSLGSDAARNEVLTYWTGKIARAYDDKASLVGLGRFFAAAEEDSRQHGNPDWVINAAMGGGGTVLSKLERLFPIYEGVYQITTRCSQDQPTNPSEAFRRCGTGYLNRLVVTHTRGGEGWSVNLVSAETGTAGYVFSGVTISKGGLVFSGTMAGLGNLTRMVYQYDPDTGAVRGTITNADREGSIVFEGRQLRSTVEVYDRQAIRLHNVGPDRIPYARLNANFRGTYGGRAASLSVRTMTVNEEPMLVATLRLDGVANYQLAFQSGSYDLERGVVLLTAFHPSGGLVKLVLTFSPSGPGGSNELRGVSLSSFAGVMQDVSLRAQ